MRDIIMILGVVTALQFIDIDKNAVKAIITGGVVGFYLARRFLNDN